MINDEITSTFLLFYIFFQIGFQVFDCGRDSVGWEANDGLCIKHIKFARIRPLEDSKGGFICFFTIPYFKHTVLKYRHNDGCVFQELQSSTEIITDHETVPRDEKGVKAAGPRLSVGKVQLNE